MRLFSKIAFIFNLAFLFAVAMRFLEKQNPAGESPLAAWQPVENTLVVMGYCAILINLLFLVLFAVKSIGKKKVSVPRWLWISNGCILILQILYFFILP